MFKKILIANRGEIAVRIIRACRELGITTAAVYSTADKTSLHTKLADESYCIGNPVSAESYLNKEKIIKLVKDIGADAVHPGYGFFSENAGFIASLEKEKITFIGPSSKSVKMMGNKTAARKLMIENNVPIVPGTIKAITSLKNGLQIAEKIGYPVLLKAAAGGGGKGMRKISSAEEFESALETTKRESLKAFASDEIYLEKFIEKPKHIEVQVLGDKKGNYVHLFERECSIQRRHQKIIEESPSSFVDEKTRNKITKAAVDAAKACSYYNAGTVEFLMDENRKFYFLEMNTRLQVEHPVTEMITGIDLVKEQINIAQGNSISFKQKDIIRKGHSIECRIYAEDPNNNFLPSTGKIFHYREPGGPGVRVDSGFTSGSEVTMYYDPLISKLVCWASDRERAIKLILRALSEYQVAGVISNIPFLSLIINNKSFKNGKFDINFLNQEFMESLSSLEKENGKEDLENIAAVFSALLKQSYNVSDVHSNTQKLNSWQEQLYE